MIVHLLFFLDSVSYFGKHSPLQDSNKTSPCVLSPSTIMIFPGRQQSTGRKELDTTERLHL